MIVVDTSIRIDHLDGKPRATEILRREAKRGPVLVPTLVAWELWKGAQTEQARERPAWDLLIAAHALHHDVPLATHDADFAPIESLELIPPRQT